MSTSSPSAPVAALMAIGVIVLTGLAMWSTHGLWSASSPQGPAMIPPQRTAISSVTEEAPTGDSKSTHAAPTSTAPPEDPLLEKIKAMLKNGHAVPNEALLTFKTRQELTEFVRNASKYGLKIISTLNGLNAVRVGFADNKLLSDYLAQAGDKAPSFEANHWMTVPTLPKTDATNQGGNVPVGDHLLASINALGDRTHWGDGVTVAVLDTGVKTHPTFSENQVTHVDLVNDGLPFHSHGTSVASLIAGQDDRVPGVSPGAHILDIRVANDKGISVSSVLAQGIIEAVDRSAQLINISLGGYDDSQVLRSAVAYASAKNVFVVAAAGNENFDKLAYPAAFPGVVSIGAVDGQNQQAYFSNSGAGLSFVAPGVGLNTAWDSDKVALVSGTSQGAAVATGVIAANYSRGVAYNQMIRQLQLHAKATGASPDKVGSGVIQVAP